MEEKLLQVNKQVKDFQLDQKFAQLRQDAHMKTVSDANTSLFWLSLLECVGVVAVSLWQVYYIKKLLDNRRVI